MALTVRITREEIALEALADEVTSADCGAVLTFLGVVRDHADGRDVESIDYTCYEGMAEKELAKVVEACMERYPVRHVAIVHRIGRLAVGVASLGLAIASPHRREAFDCGLAIIDELKKTVPIWKREIGPDGASWV